MNIKHIIFVLSASGLLAIANFWLNPNAPDLSLKPDEITLSQINRLPKNLVIVDARKSQDFKKGHVENAVNLSEEKFEPNSENFWIFGHPMRRFSYIAISDGVIPAGQLPTNCGTNAK